MALISAEALFNEINCRMLSHFVSVMSFVDVGKAGTKAALDERVQFLTTFYRNIAATESGKELMVGITQDKLDQIIINSATNQVFNFERGVHAAGIVFAHSILDGIVIDLCRVCSLANPEGFEKYIGQKKVPLSTVKESSFVEIREQFISSHLEQLGKESLLKKADVLHVVSPPKGEPIKLIDYAYDRRRLERMDKMRHEIIHGTNDYPDISDIRSETRYMAETALYFISLVADSYNYRLPRDFLSKAKMYR